VIWGKYGLSLELSEPEAYRRDVPNAQIHVLDAGHFALDTEQMRQPTWFETSAILLAEQFLRDTLADAP
jgi:hypothetical protein